MTTKRKDPAVLFYISDWLTSTAEMDADCRGWYLNLILHQYDKGDLPNNLEDLAQLAGVKFSEFQRFTEIFKQVLKQKFKQNEFGRLENEKAKQILQKRETFKDKRSESGKLGYLVKVIKEITSDTAKIEFLKNEFDFEKHQIKDKQMLKQVLKQMLKQNAKLYRNRNRNKNEIKNRNENRNENKKVNSNIPKIEDVITYFQEKGFDEELARRFHEYYEANEWKDMNGKQVKAWKQKAIGVWFDKNKQPPSKKTNRARTLPKEHFETNDGTIQ